MVSTSPRDVPDGIEFIYGERGLVTARDIEMNIAASEDTKAAALAELADALHEDGGEAIENETAFLREIGLDPAEIEAVSRRLPKPIASPQSITSPPPPCRVCLSDSSVAKSRPTHPVNSG
jgi:hypothetical protein